MDYVGCVESENREEGRRGLSLVKPVCWLKVRGSVSFPLGEMHDIGIPFHLPISKYWLYKLFWGIAFKFYVKHCFLLGFFFLVCSTQWKPLKLPVSEHVDAYFLDSKRSPIVRHTLWFNNFPLFFWKIKYFFLGEGGAFYLRIILNYF